MIYKLRIWTGNTLTKYIAKYRIQSRMSRTKILSRDREKYINDLAISSFMNYWYLYFWWMYTKTCPLNLRNLNGVQTNRRHQLHENLLGERKNDNPGLKRVNPSRDRRSFVRVEECGPKIWGDNWSRSSRPSRPLFGSCLPFFSRERETSSGRTDSRFLRRDIETLSWYAGWERK